MLSFTFFYFKKVISNFNNKYTHYFFFFYSKTQINFKIFGLLFIICTLIANVHGYQSYLQKDECRKINERFNVMALRTLKNDRIQWKRNGQGENIFCNMSGHYMEFWYEPMWSIDECTQFLNRGNISYYRCVYY